MRVSIVTLFPELFDPFLKVSMVGRAIQSGALDVRLCELRAFGIGKHRSVDDAPYGGGSGMVLRAPPVVAALEAVDEEAVRSGAGPAHRVLLTPQGRPFQQRAAKRLAALEHVALVAGRYEGFDERIRGFCHEEISLGDFVMTGGETAAMAIIESMVRLLPGVLGNAASSASESFSDALGGGLEYPQYTRPAEFRGLEAPEVLVSGDHAAVEAWRRAEVDKRTRARRPDLVQERRPAVRNVHVALVHHPVLDQSGAVVTSTVTNMDLHDMGRSALTYGVRSVFVTHPIEAQRELVRRICDHWIEGSGGRRIPDRKPALALIRIAASLEDVVEELGGSDAVEVWTTAARARSGDVVSYAEARRRLAEPGKTVLLVFGTGWGLTPATLAAAAVRLEPIGGAPGAAYNHLSVRAACAITLDRLIG
jgi:tRNA (guanine37-N1)-methyltransferase